MKKFAVYGSASLLVLLAVGYVLTRFFLGSVVQAGVNRFAPAITQTRVELAGATISPLSGTGTLTGLVVGNPKGWSDGNLCTLGRVHVVVAPFSVLGDHIVIDAIEIEAPEFNYETKLVSSNVSDLLKNIEQALGGGAAGTAASSGKPVKFEVRKFSLTNGKVRVGLGAAAMTLPMPPITLHDLGTQEGGITPNQLVFAVMKSVTAAVVGATTQAAADLGKTGGAAAAEGVKQMGETIKGFFGGKK